MRLYSQQTVIEAMGCTKAKFRRMLNKHQIAPRDHDESGERMFNVAGVSIAFIVDPEVVESRLEAVMTGRWE